MKRTIIALGLLALAAPAFAQQQQPSPPETALQINAVIGQWAQAIVQQAKLIEQQAAKIKELEAKAADKPKE